MKTKQTKKLDAIARNLTWSQLSLEQKLFALSLRPGECKKQKARLMAAS